MPYDSAERSVWTATSTTASKLSEDLKVDQFSEEELQRVFDSKPSEEDKRPYQSQLVAEEGALTAINCS